MPFPQVSPELDSFWDEPAAGTSGREESAGLSHCPSTCHLCGLEPRSVGDLSVQFSSVAQSCLTLCDPMDCSKPGLPVHPQLPELLKLMPNESVMPSNHLILCCPLLLPPSIFPRLRKDWKRSGYFPMSWFLASGGQRIGVSGSASFLPMNTQD